MWLAELDEINEKMDRWITEYISHNNPNNPEPNDQAWTKTVETLPKGISSQQIISDVVDQVDAEKAFNRAKGVIQ